jgi:hypothetical protein
MCPRPQAGSRQVMVRRGPLEEIACSTRARVAQGGVGKSSRLVFPSVRWAITACDGQKRTNHRGPKNDLCPLWSNSGQTRVRLDCPLSANRVTSHRKNSEPACGSDHTAAESHEVDHRPADWGMISFGWPLTAHAQQLVRVPRVSAWDAVITCDRRRGLFPWWGSVFAGVS